MVEMAFNKQVWPVCYGLVNGGIPSQVAQRPEGRRASWETAM